jgi:cyclopropane fatty-acyl-phospholipid synthase-like methyltransferase
MTYSCAIYTELDADLKTADSPSKDTWASNNLFKQIEDKRSRFSPSSTPPPEYVADDLYFAQMRKLHHIIDKARIRPGHRVLEIGSGWGSMAIAIARRIPGTQVDSLTLSVAQRELAMQRIEEAGLSDRIRIHLCDYRAMPAEWEGKFDRLVSVEMMEAIGKEFMETYWEKVNWALNPKTGMGCVQCITLPEARKFIHFTTRGITHVSRRIRSVLPGGRLHQEMDLPRRLHSDVDVHHGRNQQGFESPAHGRIHLEHWPALCPHIARMASSIPREIRRRHRTCLEVRVPRDHER